MVKIYIDAGHGGSDSGSVGNGIKEKDITLKIAKKVRDYLKDYSNATVKMSRTGDTFPSLKQRTNEANSWGADFFLSIHINAGGGQGYEDFIFNGNVSSKTKTCQNKLHTAVVKKNGMKDRGKKQSNLHVLRESKASAVLTENGFIDNSSDAKKMKTQSWINDVARGHVNGLADALGLKKSGAGGSGKYEVVKDIPGYATAADAKAKKNKKGTVKKGSYHTFNESQGMKNVTKQKGSPGSWINPADNKKSGGGGSKDFKVGQTVTLKKSAKKWATGESILDSAKGKKYKIIQVKSDRVLLDNVMSWAKKSDIE